MHKPTNKNIGTSLTVTTAVMDALHRCTEKVWDFHPHAASEHLHNGITVSV